MRRKRNSNRTMDLYRDSNNDYMFNLFVGFWFFPINIHCFLNL